MAIRPRILIVDDEPDLLAMMTTILSVDYEVSVLSDATDLLNYVGVTFPDLILMDVRLPQMAGDQALAVLRKNGVRIPVILYSAGYSPENIDKVRRWVSILDGQGALTKPFELDDLLNAVKAAIDAGPIKTIK